VLNIEEYIVALQKSFRHQMELIMRGYAEDFYSDSVVVREILTDKQVPSFREPFICKYRPSTIQIEVFPVKDIQNFMLQQLAGKPIDPAEKAMQLWEQMQINVKFTKRNQREKAGDKVLFERFKRYLDWLRWPTRRFHLYSKKTSRRRWNRSTKVSSAFIF